MLVISLAINVGMWLERFVIIVTGQHRSFLPSTWFDYHPTLVDAATFVGSIGLFLTLFLLFVRFVPIISMNETKELAAKSAGTESWSDTRTNVRRARTSTLKNGELPIALVAGFASANAATQACRKLVRAGIIQFDAHAPYADHELKASIPGQSSALAWITLTAGLMGGFGAFFFQRWAELRGYPMHIGGKSSGSWQTFIPVTFEVTILCAAVGCFAGLWLLCALPSRSHPILGNPCFESLSDDEFFVSVLRVDPKYALARAVLREAGARELIEVSP